MTSLRGLNWLGISLIVAWLPTVSFLVPLPTTSIEALRSYSGQFPQVVTEPGQINPGTLNNEQQRIQTERQVDFDSTKIWVEWSMKLLFAVLGIGSAIAATLRWSFWGGFVTLMAVAYLGMYVMQFQYVQDAAPEAWTTAAQISLESGRLSLVVSFFWNNLIQPAYFFAIAIYMLYYRPDVAKGGFNIKGPGSI